MARMVTLDAENTAFPSDEYILKYFKIEHFTYYLVSILHYNIFLCNNKIRISIFLCA